MRFGFTTGSCAAAASKASAFMLLTGKVKDEITVKTPAKIDFKAQIVHIHRRENAVSCAVIKDGGDDPDITTGAHIVSTVKILDNKKNLLEESQAKIVIKGGEGVGIVTKPGLDQKTGNAAINHVPREMIEREVLEVCALCDFRGTLEVEISVPEGKALAGRTFNPRLGIEGGISILGTSGIVEPMSSQALKDTILIELRQQKALNFKVAIAAPGNYGLDFMKNTFNFDLDKAVKCSNFIGDTVDMAVQTGFEKFLLVGHIGKLIKISGGIMNTHSHEADCRMELLCAAAIRAGCKLETAKAILPAVSTEQAIAEIKKEESLLNNGLLKNTMDYIIERILFFLDKRAQGKLETGCILFCNEYGLLGKSSNALELLKGM